MAPVDFSGTWTLDKSENLDEYLKELGVGWMIRQMAQAGTRAATVQTINQDGDNFVIIVTTPRRTTEEKFTVGEEYEHSMPPADIKYKCLAKWEGNALVLENTPLDTKNKPQHILRELVNDTEMLATVTLGDVVCKRYFKRQ